MFGQVGITPACAGKTAPLESTCLLVQDHPRVCGKNLKKSRENCLTLGSPPRVREKPELTDNLGIELGITPACAGKTLKDPIEIANPD